MNIDTYFDRLSLRSLFSITAILFLILGINIGLIIGVEIQKNAIIDYIDHQSTTDIKLIRFDNDYYKVEKYDRSKLIQYTENMTLIAGD